VANIKIPSRLKLLGQTILVKYVDSLNDENDADGRAVYRKNVIEIQKNNGGITRPTEMQEHTFLHELTHFILNAMGESELRGNEKFVDVFSGLLHQALVTMEYDNGK
jgi:Zn-dependent peptidase ImmA (M78 family)